MLIWLVTAISWLTAESINSSIKFPICCFRNSSVKGHHILFFFVTMLYVRGKKELSLHSIQIMPLWRIIVVLFAPILKWEARQSSADYRYTQILLSVSARKKFDAQFYNCLVCLLLSSSSSTPRSSSSHHHHYYCRPYRHYHHYLHNQHHQSHHQQHIIMINNSWPVSCPFSFSTCGTVINVSSVRDDDSCWLFVQQAASNEKTRNYGLVFFALMMNRPKHCCFDLWNTA